MIFAAIQSAASALASVATWAVPGESSPTAATESLNRLLNELKLLEKDRQKELNKALGNQEFMKHKPMTEFLSILSFVDCLFMEYLCYYDAVNTLIHSNEGSDASRKAVPAAVSQKAAPKIVDQLLNDLKEIETYRQEALKKALGNPKFKADSSMVEFLSVLSLVDSLFVEYRNYYAAMNTLIHSDPKSKDAHEAMENIKRSTKRSFELDKAIKAKSEKLYPPNLSVTGPTDLLQALFESTLEKNEEIEAELRTEFYSSPFTKNMKEMPQIPEMAEI